MLKVKMFVKREEVIKAYFCAGCYKRVTPWHKPIEGHYFHSWRCFNEYIKRSVVHVLQEGDTRSTKVR